MNVHMQEEAGKAAPPASATIKTLEFVNLDDETPAKFTLQREVRVHATPKVYTFRLK